MFLLPAWAAGTLRDSNPEKYGPEGGLLDQKGGGFFGYTDTGGYNGGQAEYVRVPYANFGPRKVTSDFSYEEVLFLTTFCLPDTRQSIGRSCKVGRRSRSLAAGRWDS